MNNNVFGEPSRRFIRIFGPDNTDNTDDTSYTHTETEQFKVDLRFHEDDKERQFSKLKSIDECIPQIPQIPESVREHLNKPFVPSEKLKTPFLQDILKTVPMPKMRYLEMQNRIPADDGIIAFDDPHVYFMKDPVTGVMSCENIISSTTFLHCFFPPFDAVGQAHSTWSSKTFQDYLKSWINGKKAPQEKIRYDEDVKKFIANNGRKPKRGEVEPIRFKECKKFSYKYFGCETPQDIMDRWTLWMNLGTATHLSIEKFCNDEPMDVRDQHKCICESHNVEKDLNDPSVLEVQQHCFNQFLKVFNDKYFWKWKHYRTEWTIYDQETRFAGKIDYAGIDDYGNIILLDWKRVGDIGDSSFARFQGKPPEMGYGVCSGLENCKLDQYSLQLNSYKYVLKKNYGLHVSKMFLIQLHPSLTHKDGRGKNKVVTCGQANVIMVRDMEDTIIKMFACRKIVLQNQLAKQPLQQPSTNIQPDNSMIICD